MSIEVKNLVKIFDEKRVIDDVSFTVEDGETLAIVGFSGSGKSTILKLICGLIEKDEGEIITSEGDIAMVFQYSALFDSLDVADNISFALRERRELRNRYSEEELEKIVAQKLELVGLKETGLDPISSTLIEDYIVRLKQETNAASIVVTHQMSTITRTANKIIMLYDGKIVFAGTPEEMLRQDTPYTKQFVTASLEGPMKMIA